MAKRGTGDSADRSGQLRNVFESEDLTLDRMFALPSSHRTLEAALPEALRLACALPDWQLGRCRTLGAAGDPDGRWTWHRPHAARRSPGTVDPVIAAQREASAVDDDTPPLSIRLLCPIESVLHARLHEAGLRTECRLLVRAEDRPAAVLEVFGWQRVDSRGLRILLARLEHVAARDRSRAAVRRAAAYVRAAGAPKPATTEVALDPKPPLTAPGCHPATGLPTGNILEDRLQMAIHRRRRGDAGLLAVYHVAPGLGFDSPDVALAALARRLAAVVRDVDTVGHGREPGEFVVVAEGLADLEAARELGRRLLAAGRKPVAYAPGSRPLPCRVGLVVAGPASDSVPKILRDAELAANRAPTEGGLEMFDPAVRVDDDMKGLIEAELRRALGSRELFLEYQPIVSLSDGRIAGLEAFIRWQHPKVGRIPPEEFIGVAEVSPLIHELGDWVTDQVCQQIRRWATHVPPSRIPAVDVNFSQTQLLHADFVGRIARILRGNELPGEAIRIDVNESDLMEAPDSVIGLLERLRRHGVCAAIDDFGTGFSSLQMLHALPVTALKIDGAFLPGAASGADAWVIARSIVELGKVLGLDVIAEGVETRDQIRTLRQLGCRLGQGYAFSGPVGAGRALELIRDGYPLEMGSTAG